MSETLERVVLRTAILVVAAAAMLVAQTPPARRFTAQTAAPPNGIRFATDTSVTVDSAVLDWDLAIQREDVSYPATSFRGISATAIRGFL